MVAAPRTRTVGTAACGLVERRPVGQELPLSFSATPDSATTSDNPPQTDAVPAAPAPGKSLLREIIETILLTVIIYLSVNFATGRFRIEGSSMEPSMHQNQYVLVDKISYKLGNPKRGDVVVFNYPLEIGRASCRERV